MTKKPTKLSLMFQGTGSDVGKSLLVAGLCRAFVRRGLKVAPFKPQNMSNNAAVTPDGGEIGRAQALQAAACGLEPSVDMNPVLLKPQSDLGSQLIVRGEVRGSYKYKDYLPLKPRLLKEVLESYNRLCTAYDLVLIEGAGSAAEVNLRDGDIANMGFAEAANVPVLLVADIDRGGVIASIVGTHHLIRESEKSRLKGYVINKFRGDASLFTPALETISKACGLESLGIVPYFNEAKWLPDEDAMSLDNRKTVNQDKPVKISVLRYPRIANFDDLDPLYQDPRLEITLLEAGDILKGDQDLVILPGSKTTLSDFEFLKKQGWDIDLISHVRRGGFVIGLCGGYQMMGKIISDPDGIEGPPQILESLGLFDMNTELKGPKTLEQATGSTYENHFAVQGYEMHMGVSTRKVGQRPFLVLNGQEEGHISEDGRIMGTYLHGLFHSDEFRNDLVTKLSGGELSEKIFIKQQDDVLNLLADHLEKNCDLEAMLDIAKG